MSLDLSMMEAKKIDEIAKEKGKLFAQGEQNPRGGRRNINIVKTNQVRNVFGHITSIRTKHKQAKKWTPEIERELILLKPKLAYAKGRNKDVVNFQEFMFDAIDGVVNAQKTDKDTALRNFFVLIESVVAYHKFYGGKDN